jgi:hypothetical protein
VREEKTRHVTYKYRALGMRKRGRKQEKREQRKRTEKESRE